jgi:outer membrane protein OmpA-like peptidoglycan-associated protein
MKSERGRIGEKKGDATMHDRIWGVSGVLLGVLIITACATPGPPPNELVEARLALQDAKAANADTRATRSYDSAAANLDIANKSWDKDHDEAAILHQARLAEAEARKAQYAAETQAAEEAIRRETNRKNRHELALRDAELILLRQKEQEAELERMKALSKEQEQALLAAKEKMAAERARAEQEKLAALAAEEARAEQAERELARLRAEHEKSKAELTATLSRLAKVREDARGVIVTLPGNIYFNFNKADVKPAMQMQLTKIAKALAAVPNQNLLIEGHTDSIGSNEYNLSLSESRAQSVQKILLDGGIAAERMEIKGYGESKPIADNATPSGQAQNRRVEIVLIPTKQ